MTMALQRLHKTWRWIVWSLDRRKERVSICARQNHALMLVEKPARTFIGKIAGGKTSDRHGLPNDFFGQRCKA
jgi:hypothetical protein